MKTRSFLIAAVLVAAAATSAFAALSPAKAEWGKGPVQYFMTNEEKAAWNAIQTDADADAFIALFWARRDPTPATPRNEFHEDFDARVKAADDTLSRGGRVRGSMTDPGRILILFGAPTKATRSTAPGGGVSGTRGDMRNAEVGSAFSSSGFSDMTWIFEGDPAQKVFGVAHVEMKFHDQYNDGNFKLQQPPVDLTAAAQRIVNSLITQPTLTKAPTFAAGGAQKPGLPAAPVAGVKTPALEAALTEAKGGKANNRGGMFDYAEFVSPAGDSFVPVQVYVPSSAGIAADGADTIFGAIEDASGTRVTTFEEPAKLTASRTDFFVDKTLTLQPGKYTAIVGLAKGGTPVLVTSGPIEVAGPSKESVGTSRLILSDNVYELGTAEPPKAPFAFGKLKIVPKGNLTFKATDELNYFVEVFNPGIEADGGVGVKTITEQTSPATSVSVSQPVKIGGAPKLQMKLDLVGGPDKVTIPAPLMDAPALPLSGTLGRGPYAIISAVPLAEIKPALKPGDYTLKIKIIDTISKQSYTVEQSFKISG